MLKRNKILILMSISMVLGYLPWYNFSAVSRYILNEFNLSTQDMGLILSIFQVGYVITVIITGWLADKIGRKKIIFIATLMTGIFSIIFSVTVQGFKSILILRLLTGMSAGAIYAPGIALLTKWFPAKKRGMAVGAYTGALTAAYAGGYFIAAPIAATINWRFAILATSIPAIIAALIIYFFIDEKPEEDNLMENEKGMVSVTSDINTLSLRKKRMGIVLSIVGYTGHMWELYGFWGWIGPFLVASAFASGYGIIDATMVGNSLAAMVILIGAPAVWLVGIGSDRWGKERIMIGVATCSLIAELFFGFLYGKNLAIVTFVGLWIGFWSVADSGSYKVVLADFVDSNKTATLLGIQSAVGYSITILSTYLFGAVLEKSNNGIIESIYSTHWGLSFLMLGVGAIIAPTCMIFLRRLHNAI